MKSGLNSVNKLCEASKRGKDSKKNVKRHMNRKGIVWASGRFNLRVNASDIKGDMMA